MFSRGLRNPQGLFVDDELILSTEHGPKGGDELNLIVQGEDYGWPVVSYGFECYLEDNYQRPHRPEAGGDYFGPSAAMGM
jgi:glucose/arabinose dehydrogenase